MNTHQLETDKLNIINWISQLQDYSVVEKVKQLMLSPDECTLNPKQKKAIDDALISLDTNGAIPHNVVMEETKKRFANLFNR